LDEKGGTFFFIRVLAASIILTKGRSWSIGVQGKGDVVGQKDIKHQKD